MANKAGVELITWYKSINQFIIEPNISPKMSHSEYTVNSNSSLPQAEATLQMENQAQNEENSTILDPLRPQPEPMDIESSYQKSSSQDDNEESEFVCPGRGRRRGRKINKLKKGNSNYCPPKPIPTRTKRSTELQKLKSSQSSIQWFILKDEYMKTSISCYEDVLNCQNISPIQIEQSLNEQSKQNALALINPQEAPNQVLVHYQTFQFKNDNLRVYCWSLAPSQTEETLTRKRTRGSAYFQMDDDDALVFQKLGLSQQNIKIYFNNAKYRFKIPTACKTIDQLNSNQELTARNKQNQFLFHLQQQVPVPKLLRKDELAQHVATKREMLARRTASSLQDE